MILYFADRHLNILGQATTHLPEGVRVIKDLKTEDVDTGVAIFECRIPFDRKTRAKVEEWAEVGNYILRSSDNENEFYNITDAEIDTKRQEVYIYAEDDGLDLLNDVAEAYEADQPYPISSYIERFAGGAGWEIGINEVEGLTKKLSWDSEQTASARLLSIAESFNNCELSYSFEINGLQISKKYINIYEERGKDTGIQLRLNKEVDSIITTKSITNLATALNVTGGTPADADAPITLLGYEYDDGDFYVDGKVLKSRKALDKWSRYLWRDDESKQSGGHIVKSFSYATTSQAVLCEKAIEKLKAICDMEVNYDVDISKFPENVKVGDRVNIVDDAGELYLSSRVLILETSVSDMTKKAVLGEHIIKKDGISEKVEALAEQFANIAQSRVFYTWIAYADDENGTNITIESEGKKYIGIAANRTEEAVDISDPSVFTWSKIKGEDGDSPYTLNLEKPIIVCKVSSTGEVEEDTKLWLPLEIKKNGIAVPGKFVVSIKDEWQDTNSSWEYNEVFSTYTNHSEGYISFPFTIPKGYKAPTSGYDYISICAEPGSSDVYVDLDNPYLSGIVTVSFVKDGESPINIYVDESYKEDTCRVSATGEVLYDTNIDVNEIALRKGNEYVPAYYYISKDDIHDKGWVFNSNTGWVEKESLVKIDRFNSTVNFGVHVNFKIPKGYKFSDDDLKRGYATVYLYINDEKDSVSTALYTYVIKIRLLSDPVSISTVTEKYQVSGSKTDAPTEWVDEAPEMTAKLPYLWNYEVITYSDGSTEDTTQRVIGMYAEGKEGRGIKEITNYYAVNNDPLNHPTNWEDTMQTTSADKPYLWTKEFIEYTDGTTKQTNPIIIGTHGATGADAVAYSMITNVGAIVRTASGKYIPESIILYGRSQSGTDTISPYAGRFKIDSTSDNDNWTENVYQSQNNENEVTFKVPADIKALRCSFYKGGGFTTKLDEQTIPVVSDGLDGDGYTVILTNDSHTFAATYDGKAVSGHATCKVFAYKGGSRVSATIGEVTDIPDGMTVSVDSTKNGTVDAEFTVTVDSDMITESGTITIPVTVDGKSFEKLMTYSLALAGPKGDKGDTGDSISTVKNYYLATSSSSGVTVSTSGWTEAVQTPTAAKKYLWNYEEIIYTGDKTATKTTPCIIGVFGADGKGIKSITEHYLASASSSGVTTGTSGWSTDMQLTDSTKKYLWNYETVTYTDNSTSTTDPVIIGVHGEKGDKGDTVSVSSVTEYYAKSNSNTSAPTSWSTTVPTLTNTDKYLWNYEVINYTDGTSTETSKRVMGVYGDTGSTGKGISSITNYYLATSSSSGVTTGTSGWTTAVQTMTSTKKYLWNYEVIAYTSGNPTTTTPVIIGTYGDKGDPGKSISGVVNYYLATNSSSGVTVSTSGWTEAVQTPTASKKYLWNYEKVTYSDTTYTTTAPCIIGNFAEEGKEGVSISSVTEYYARSSSSTSAPADSSFGTSVPTLDATYKYLWNYEKIEYTGGKAATTTPKCVIGVYGDKGDQGDPGKGVKSTVVTYQGSTSGTSTPTGTWLTYIPSLSQGYYLWTRTVITYTDDTTSTSYSVSRIGIDGTNGTNGKDGQMLYATCDTAAGTQIKAATLSTGTLSSLVAGATVTVKFTNANTNAIPLLAIYNGSTNTGNKYIKANTVIPSASNPYYWKAGTVLTFVYDGSYWVATDTAETKTELTDAGFVVGNWSGNTLQNNVLIGASTIDIRYGNTIYASYGANTIYLGKNSSKSTIDLCNGTATMKLNSTDYAVELFEIAVPAGSIALSSTNRIFLDAHYSSGVDYGYADMSFDAQNPYWNARTYYYDSLKKNTYESYISIDHIGKIELFSSIPDHQVYMEIDAQNDRIYTYGDFSVNGNVTVSKMINANGHILLPSEVYLYGTSSINSGKVVEALNETMGYKRSLIHYSASNNTVIGWGGWYAEEGATRIYGNKVAFIVGKADSSTTYRPYFSAGDTLSLTWTGSGYISSSSKGVYFTIPLAKPVIGNPTITVVSDGGMKIRQNGGYCFGSGSSAYVTTGTYKGELSADGNFIRISVTMDNTTNVTNNDTCGIEANIKITFS